MHADGVLLFGKYLLIRFFTIVLFLASSCHTNKPDRPTIEDENGYRRYDTRDIVLDDGTSVRLIDTGNICENTLLIVHGWLGSSGNFVRLIEQVPDDIRVIVPDLPGFGESGKPETNYDIGYYIEFLSKLLNHLNLKTVTVAASSMGCIISTHYAVAYPDTVQNLILISPVGLPGQNSFLLNLASRESLIDRYSSRISRDDVERLVTRHVVADPESATEELIDSYYHSLSTERGREVVARITYNILGCCRIPEEVFESDRKVLIIFGESDPMARHATQSALNLPGENCRFLVIPECAHVPFFEQPEEFSLILLDFMRSASVKQF